MESSYSPEMCMLKLFVKDRDAFENYYDQIKGFKQDTEIKVLLQTILKYYETYQEHSYIGASELKLWYDTLYSLTKNREIIYTIIDTIYSIEISDSIIKDLIKNMIEKEVALSIIEKLSPILTENKFGVLTTISDDLAKYDMLLEHQDDESMFVSNDIAKLQESREANGYLIWRLKCLQDDIGKVVGGYLGHVAARPETGKTSFLASEISYMLRQLQEDECILWCNNEQLGADVMGRIYSAMLNQPLEVILANIEQAKELFYKYGGHRLKLYDNAFISYEQIRAMIRMCHPKLVIIDQGDKITFSGGAKMDTTIRLKELYRMFRELAKSENTHILTVGQASSEAAGKKWIEMHHLDYSKTGKAAEMDYIIGLGKTSDEGEEEIRFINLSKNKLTGRHSKHTVKFNNIVGRYSDL